MPLVMCTGVQFDSSKKKKAIDRKKEDICEIHELTRREIAISKIAYM